MAIHDPWLPQAALEYSQSGQHVTTAVVYDIAAPSVRYPLDLLPGSTLTYDEDASPYVQAVVSVPAPQTVADLDFFDPRLKLRLELSAGYVYASGRRDVQVIADLQVRERVMRHPQSDMTLTAVSDDLTAVDALHPAGLSYYSDTDTCEAVITNLLWYATLTHPSASHPVLNTSGAHQFAAPGTYEHIAAGASIWGFIQGMADRAGCRVFHDGLGKWRLVPEVTNTLGVVALELTTGAQGTVTSYERSNTRDGWFNNVTLRWAESKVGGLNNLAQAELSSGPHTPAQVGSFCYTEQRPWEQWPGLPIAKVQAVNLLRRALSRAISASVESANSAYWLRPGHIVALTLPPSARELHIVKSVTFDMPAGSMHVRTRVPGTGTIIN